MTRKLLVLALIAPFCGGIAMAQTTDTATSSTSGDDFGSDWSRTLGSAIFSDPEMTEMRPGSEISSQWATMSAEDKAMLKRDCATHDTRMGAAGSTTGDSSSSASTDSSAASTGTGTDSTVSTGTNSSGSASTDTSTSTGSTGTSGETTAMTIRVNATQMNDICEAIKTLN
jgi:hypothetical protein